MHNSKISIPIHELNMAVPKSNVRYSETIFSEGIKGLNIIHYAFTTAGNYPLVVMQDDVSVVTIVNSDLYGVFHASFYSLADIILEAEVSTNMLADMMSINIDIAFYYNSFLGSVYA